MLQPLVNCCCCSVFSSSFLLTCIKTTTRNELARLGMGTIFLVTCIFVQFGYNFTRKWLNCTRLLLVKLPRHLLVKLYPYYTQKHVITYTYSTLTRVISFVCVCRGPKNVGGITWAKHAHAHSQYWAVKSDQ